jgi:predicted ATPase
MSHLRSLTIASATSGAFPFNVPAIRSLNTLRLDTPVTFFVGQNGSGKSTLLEGISLAADLPTIGSVAVANDSTLDAQRALAKALKLVWTRRVRRGFFLRAEDFFGFTKHLTRLRSELSGRVAELDDEYRDRSTYAKGLAQGPALGSLAELERRYGADLDANSHGESFLKLFESRFVPGGLFLMDEPEAALSPQSQLALMAMLYQMVASDGQFIIATHSPILLAYPEARIYSFDGGNVNEARYDDLEHVVLTREFLAAPERYLRHLAEVSASPRASNARSKRRS